MLLEMQLGFEPTDVPGKMPNLGENLIGFKSFQICNPIHRACI